VCRARGVTPCFWLVTRYDDVVFVLKDNQFAADRIPEGIYDSPGRPVEPVSLYLEQLRERLGDAALVNIGYK
jgi:cytochrome P450